jgi:hypothetical protein
MKKSQNSINQDLSYYFFLNDERIRSRICEVQKLKDPDPQHVNTSGTAPITYQGGSDVSKSNSGLGMDKYHVSYFESFDTDRRPCHAARLKKIPDPGSRSASKILVFFNPSSRNNAWDVSPGSRFFSSRIPD